jgi:hypothetical protein
LAVSQVIALECSDNEDDIVQGSTAPITADASSAVFTWEDMKNYARQTKQFVGNCGPQNEGQNETYCAEVYKMFLLMNWWN